MHCEQKNHTGSYNVAQIELLQGAGAIEQETLKSRHEAMFMHINGYKDGEEFAAFSLSLTFAQWLMRRVAQAPF